jgi:hypothetical protein
MGEKNFKQIGKFQFSLDIPIDSDLMLAIKLGTEKRDKTVNELADLLKGGIEVEHRIKVDALIDGILKQNESIKLMEDAAVAVRMYKLDHKENEEHNK